MGAPHHNNGAGLMAAKAAPGELSVQLLTMLRYSPKTSLQLAAEVGGETQRVTNGMRHSIDLGRARIVHSGKSRSDPSIYEITQAGLDYLSDPMAGHKAWPKDVTEFLVAHWGKPDWPNNRIAEHVGRSATTIKRMAVALGLPDLTHNEPWTEDRIKELRWLAGEGFSMRGAGKALGISKGAIGSAAKKFGVAFNGVREKAAKPQPQDKPVPAKTEAPPHTKPPRKPRLYVIPDTAKPWIEREFGECAFPVSGQGADTFSCCKPVWRNGYCEDCYGVMHQPSEQTAPTTPSVIRRRA